MERWQEEAIRLFDDGNSYSGISRVLGMCRQTITRYLHSRGLYREVHEKVVSANARTADKLRKDYTYVCKQCGIEYSPKSKERDTYCSRECSFTAMGERKYEKERKCIHCGESYVWGRDEWKHGKFCSARCDIANKTITKTCKRCGKVFETTWSLKEYCSDKCIYQQVLDGQRERYVKLPEQEKECQDCGETFVTSNPARLTCDNPLCRTEAYKAARRKERVKRRIALQAQWVEDVPLEYLIYRDEGVCKLCGKKVKLDKAVPHPKAPTNDHVIPLSQGGEHSKRNCQLAHFECNSKKSDKSLGAEQLALFG